MRLVLTSRENDDMLEGRGAKVGSQVNSRGFQGAARPRGWLNCAPLKGVTRFNRYSNGGVRERNRQLSIGITTKCSLVFVQRGNQVIHR